MNFDARREVSELHEVEVRARLDGYGFLTARFGVAMLPDGVRKVLREYPGERIRWLPDILAIRRDLGPIFVDAKCGRLDTPNYAIERDALETQLAIQTAFDVPVYFVFGDHQVIRADGCCDSTVKPGPYLGRGSGTPYLLIPKQIAADWDDVFPLLEEAVA